MSAMAHVDRLMAAKCLRGSEFATRLHSHTYAHTSPAAPIATFDKRLRNTVQCCRPVASTLHTHRHTSPGLMDRLTLALTVHAQSATIRHGKVLAGSELATWTQHSHTLTPLAGPDGHCRATTVQDSPTLLSVALDLTHYSLTPPRVY